MTVDVSKAFDAVHVDKLLQIATPILQSSQYLMVKYAEVTCLSLFSPKFTAKLALSRYAILMTRL